MCNVPGEVVLRLLYVEMTTAWIGTSRDVQHAIQRQPAPLVLSMLAMVLSVKSGNKIEVGGVARRGVAWRGVSYD